MTGEPIIANPLGYAQHRLMGGWPRICSFAGIYTGSAIVIMILFYRMLRMDDPITLSSFADGALSVFSSLMGIFLIFGGVTAIKRAVQRDFVTDMISSHRVSAMSGHAAVLGYLTGANAMILMFTLANLLICMILCRLAEHSTLAPFGLLLFLGSAAMMWWAFAALIGLATRGATSVAGMITVLIFLAFFNVAHALPGLSLILGYSSLAQVQSAGITGIDEGSMVVGMLGQLALGLTFFLAASRKFIRDDVQAFNPFLATALLALCSLLCAIGLRFYPPAPGRMFPPSFADTDVQSITTLAALALLSILSIASAARRSADWARRRAKDPDFSKPRPRAIIFQPAAATLVVFGILASIIMPIAKPLLFPTYTEAVLVAPPDLDAGDDAVPSPEPVIETITRAPTAVAFSLVGSLVGFFFLTLLTLSGLLRFVYAYSNRAVWIIALYLVVVWALPPLVDLSLEVVQDRPPLESRSILFGFSPIGAWIAAFTHMTVNLLPGLVFNTLLAIGAIVLARKARY